MNAKHWFATQVSIVLLGGGLFLVQAQAGQQADKKVALRGNLEGTWRMVAYKYRDAARFTDIPRQEQTHLKYITAHHFIWVDYDPMTKEMSNSAGGRYVLNGAVLKETPEFGLGSASTAMRNKEQTYTIRVEGNTYRQSGTLMFGGKSPEAMKLEEVWERVE